MGGPRRTQSAASNAATKAGATAKGNKGKGKGGKNAQLQKLSKIVGEIKAGMTVSMSRVGLVTYTEWKKSRIAYLAEIEKKGEEVDGDKKMQDTTLLGDGTPVQPAAGAKDKSSNKRHRSAKRMKKSQEEEEDEGPTPINLDEKLIAEKHKEDLTVSVWKSQMMEYVAEKLRTDQLTMLHKKKVLSEDSAGFRKPVETTETWKAEDCLACNTKLDELARAFDKLAKNPEYIRWLAVNVNTGFADAYLKFVAEAMQINSLIISKQNPTTKYLMDYYIRENVPQSEQNKRRQLKAIQRRAEADILNADKSSDDGDSEDDGDGDEDESEDEAARNEDEDALEAYGAGRPKAKAKAKANTKPANPKKGHGEEADRGRKKDKVNSGSRSKKRRDGKEQHLREQIAKLTKELEANKKVGKNKAEEGKGKGGVSK